MTGQAPIVPKLRALPNQRPSTNGWTLSSCPGPNHKHGDRNQSFQWIEDEHDGHVGIKCFTGCTPEDIVAALGCTMADLFAPSSPNGYGRRADLNGTRPHKPAPGPKVRTRRYVVTDTNGGQYAHVRPEDEHGRKVGRPYWEPPGVKLNDLRPYGYELLADHRATDPVFLVEGEATAEALTGHGLLALATFGTSYQPTAEALEALTGRPVVLWADADKPGRAHMLDMAKRLDGIAARLRWIEPPADAFDGWDAANATPDQIRALLRAAGPVPADPRNEPPEGIDAADLLALELPPLRWVLPDIIPEGTTVLASPPKVGKSCFIYQVAVEAALGGELIGRRVTSGSVLYLALEDGRRRGQERLRAALAGRTMPRGRLEVRWSSRKIGAGLEADVAAWLDGHPDAVMVAIDTLGKVRPPSNGRRNAYEVDVEALAGLQDLFRDRPVALVIVHHARKEGADDFLASVSGTYGITGSADTIVVIKRPRLEAFGAVYVTGRDVPDCRVSARFDGLTWTLAPDQLSEASFERQEVYATIEAEGPIFPAAIARLTGLERTSVQHMVEALVAGGSVARTAKGYAIADESSLARARVGTVSGHSNHSESDQSDWGHDARARALAPVVATAEVAERIACDDYSGHQRHHRFDGGRWVCDVCSGHPSGASAIVANPTRPATADPSAGGSRTSPPHTGLRMA